MRTIVKITFFVFTIGLMVSCKKENNCDLKKATVENIIGKWQFGPPAEPTEGYATYDVFFTRDSFYIAHQVISDYHLLGTPCASGIWENYSKGKYSLQNGNMLFEGFFTTDNTYSSPKISIDSTTECFNKYFGSFQCNLKASFCGDTLILDDEVICFNPFTLFHIPLTRK